MARKLAVHSQGQGPDLVLLHGWGLHSGVWSSLMEQLADGFTCHAVDLPGHGYSPAGWRGINNWCDAVAEVMPERAAVVGWSLGGSIAMQLALRHARRVNALVLISATPRFQRAADWPHGLSAGNLQDMAGSLQGDFVATLQEFLILQMLGQPKARILLRELRQSLLDKPPRMAGLEAGLDILRDTDLRDRIAGINQPALVIAGERDRLTHPAVGRWLGENLPRAEFWPVPRSAHAPFISHDRECARHIREFAGT